MPWEFQQKSPIFSQIVDRLQTDILNGTYPPGSQIPPVRQLAAEASVNPNTMQRALTELEARGLLESRGTVGRFVTSDEKTLQNAHRSAKTAVLETLMKQAENLGVTPEEIIAFLEQRKKGKESQSDGK